MLRTQFGHSKEISFSKETFYVESRRVVELVRERLIDENCIIENNPLLIKNSKIENGRGTCIEFKSLAELNELKSSGKKSNKVSLNPHPENTSILELAQGASQSVVDVDVYVGTPEGISDKIRTYVKEVAKSRMDKIDEIEESYEESKSPTESPEKSVQMALAVLKAIIFSVESTEKQKEIYRSKPEAKSSLRA